VVSKDESEKSKLIAYLPHEEYMRLVAASDVGLIFLDHRFTIPNFPSRLLSYMEMRMPVLVVTDPNTDVGKVVEEGGFGYWCESNDVNQFIKLMRKMIDCDRKSMGERAYQYLNDNYTSEKVYEIIIKHIEEKRNFNE